MKDIELKQKLQVIANKNFCIFQKLLNKTNLTAIEFEILRYIYLEPNQRANASCLAAYFEVSIAAIMHKLTSLVERKILVKSISTGDHRKKYYTISSEALKLYEYIHNRYTAYLNNYLQALAEEVPHLAKILDLTIEFMEEENV